MIEMKDPQRLAAAIDTFRRNADTLDWAKVSPSVRIILEYGTPACRRVVEAWLSRATAKTQAIRADMPTYTLEQLREATQGLGPAMKLTEAEQATLERALWPLTGFPSPETAAVAFYQAALALDPDALEAPAAFLSGPQGTPETRAMVIHVLDELNRLIDAMSLTSGYAPTENGDVEPVVSLKDLAKALGTDEQTLIDLSRQYEAETGETLIERRQFYRVQ